ncbi:hypothetical protein [Rhodanobacter umsongensis]
MVKALVYDIRDLACPLPSKIFIDTNAWLLWGYAPFSLPGTGHQRATHYTDYMANLVGAQKSLYRSAFCLPEIAHVVEDDQLSTYNQGKPKQTGRKEARGILNLRRKVATSVVATWRTVEQVSLPSIGIMVDDGLAQSALARFGQQKLDGYDLFIVEEVLLSGFPILTDDADYISVTGLCVFTANDRAIQEAGAAARLRTVYPPTGT